MCDYLSLCVFYSGLADFGLEGCFSHFQTQRHFSHFVGKGKLVFLLRRFFFDVLVRIVIFTKIETTVVII